MIELELLQAIWRILSHEDQADIPARELEQISLPYGSPLLTVDTENLRHLLIPISPDLAVSEDKKSGGIHVADAHWAVDEYNRRVVDIVCLKPHLNDIFNHVILDIFDTLADDNGYHPDRAARMTLERWRELLAADNQSNITISKLTGLYGELWFLREIIKQEPEGISLWRGPLGERFDFYNGHSAVEVKTTRQRKGKNLTINGHDQLQEPEDGDLYLLRLQVETGESAQESVTDVITAISNLGGSIRRLEQILFQAGLTRSELDSHHDIKFNTLTVDFYKVNDDFPRITSQSFKGNRLPSGISSIEYVINLDSRPPYPLSEDEINQLIKLLTGDPA